MNNNTEPERDPLEPAPEPQQEQPTISMRLIQGKSIVTWVLLTVTVVVYLLQLISQYRYGVDWPLMYGAKYTPYIKMGEYWRLVTPIFLHSSVMHILCNMYALFTLGPSLEKYYGRLSFLRLYILTGIGGNVLSYILSPYSVSVGASSALFGLIGAQAMFLYKNRRVIRNYRSLMQNIVFVVVINIFFGLQGGIDNWAHLGGFVTGLLIGFFSGPQIGFLQEAQTGRVRIIDIVSTKQREIGYFLVFLLLCAAVFAF